MLNNNVHDLPIRAVKALSQTSRLFLVRVHGIRKALLSMKGKGRTETSDEADDEVIITQLWHC